MAISEKGAREFSLPVNKSTSSPFVTIDLLELFEDAKDEPLVVRLGIDEIDTVHWNLQKQLQQWLIAHGNSDIQVTGYHAGYIMNSLSMYPENFSVEIEFPIGYIVRLHRQ